MWRAARQDKKPKMTPANNYDNNASQLWLSASVGMYASHMVSGYDLRMTHNIY